MNLKDIKKRQNIHFSHEKSAKTVITNDDLEDYLDQVTKKYHQDRRKEWAKGYKKNLIMKYGSKKELGKLI